MRFGCFASETHGFVLGSRRRSHRGLIDPFVDDIAPDHKLPDGAAIDDRLARTARRSGPVRAAAPRDIERDSAYASGSSIDR